jgi:thiopeptide-type bacteriocin biosynthesis protein
LYGGHASLDKLLTRDLSPFIHATLGSGVVARWFFLRFSDPDQHLRIRFQGRPDRLSQELLPLLICVLNPLLAASKIWKIQFDTYEREIERYGGTEGILSAEEIFFYDSQAVLAILEQLDRESNPNLRWQIALLGCDMLLSDLGFSLKDKRSMMEGLRNKYGVEFRASGDRRRLLADSFRAKRALFDALLCVPHTQDPALALARRTFQMRSDRTGAAIHDLQRLAESGRLLTDVSEIAASMIHMHVNRLMQSSPRQHECVLYDFLYRIYDGRLARTHDNGKSASSALL